MIKKLNTVPHEETKHLVTKFFQKIITLKEIEHKKHLENGELQVILKQKKIIKFIKNHLEIINYPKVQLEEQNQLVDQLKQALNTSTSELDKRLIEQKNKAEKTNKMLTQQLNDCTKKISLLELEISKYQEKLAKSKSQFDSDSTSNMNGNNNNNNNSNGFYLKNNNDLERSDKSAVTKAIKVSRKDLRRLTEEDILKRSLKTSTVSNNYLDNDSDEKN